MSQADDGSLALWFECYITDKTSQTIKSVFYTTSVSHLINLPYSTAMLVLLTPSNRIQIQHGNKINTCACVLIASVNNAGANHTSCVALISMTSQKC